MHARVSRLPLSLSFSVCVRVRVSSSGLLMRTFRERRESKKVENYPEARSKRRLEKGGVKRANLSRAVFLGESSKKKASCRKRNLTSAERE